MTKILLKAHVKGYTRADGSFVKEHDDSRVAAVPYQKPDHVKNTADELHHLGRIDKDKRSPEEHKRFLQLQARHMKHGVHNAPLSPEYKAHTGGKSKYDHPHVVGKAEKLQGGGADKANGFHFAGKEYTASGKTGKSMHDDTPVRHFREVTKDGADTGEHVWLDDSGRVHADSQSEVAGLRKRGEAKSASAPDDSGHVLNQGPVKHADSRAADKWMDDTIGKLKDSGYEHKGFTVHGSTWTHPDHGDLHIMHGVSNPADKSDDSVYSSVKHGDNLEKGKD